MSGIDYSPHSLLLSSTLNSQNLVQPVSQYCHDYMHCLCSKGVLCFVSFWLVDALCHAGMHDIWDSLHSFLQLWVPPGAFKSIKPHDLFHPKQVEAHKSSKYLKSTASEMLSLYRHLAYYVRACCLPSNFLPAECNCFWLGVMCLTFV